MLFPVPQVDHDFTKVNKLIYGYPKSGKSTLASLMVDKEGRVPLFLASEKGHTSLRVSAANITSWDGLLKCTDLLEKEVTRVKAEHSTIVLDLISDFDAWCGTAIATKKNVEYVGDLEMGKGWKLMRDEFQKNITRIFNLLPVTFIAHTQDKKITWNGEQITTQAPSLSKAALDFVNGKVDAIMFINPSNSKKEFPEITMQPSTAHIAGSRQRALCRAFRYDPANPKAAWDEICALYSQAQMQLAQTASATQQAQPSVPTA